MKIIKKETTASTQSELKSLLKEGSTPPLALWSKEQTAGKGRHERPWVSFEKALFLSFTYEANKVLTLTSIELAILVAKFFNTHYKTRIKLKWPNDFLLDNKKIGGLIIENLSNDILVCGLGINLNSSNPSQVPDQPISSLELNMEPEDLVGELLCFLVQNRLDAKQIEQEWSKLCSHNQSNVQIVEDTKTLHGQYKGIGQYGQLLLETDEGAVEVYNGTLKIKINKS